MNDFVEQTLSGITNSNNEIVSVLWMNYEGEDDAYITYEMIGNSHALDADDTVQDVLIIYDIDIFSKNNYNKIRKQVYEKMMAAGFIWVEESKDMYEEDTQYHHKTITFKIERSLEEWLTSD